MVSQTIRSSSDISRVFSLAGHDNKHDFSNFPNTYKIQELWKQNIFTSYQNSSQSLSYFKGRKACNFLRHPSFLHPHTGYRFDQIMRDHIANFHKFKCWYKTELTFNSKTFIYASVACECNMHENMTFVVGKLNLVSYQFVSRCPPPPPPPPLRHKKSVGLRNVATYIHNICKGHLGSSGEQVCKG